MKRWKKRIISMLLVASMVIGLAPITPLQVEAASLNNLGDADGIIWLTKKGEGENADVSDDFISLAPNLADMVCEALVEKEDTEVYYGDINIRDPLALLANFNTLKDTLKKAISNHELVTFQVGKDRTSRTIAFRNFESVTIGVGDDNAIYVDNPGAPESAADLETLITSAIDNTKVVVSHDGTVATKIGNAKDLKENKARFEVSEFKAVSKNLLNLWPVSGEPTRKAGTITVTLHAEEYSVNPGNKAYTKTETITVYLRDERVTVNAAVEVDGKYLQDDELKAFKATYSGNAKKAPTVKPGLKNYTFKEWKANCYEGYLWTAIMEPKNDRNGNGLADENDPLEKHTVNYYYKPDGETEVLLFTETVEHGKTASGPSDELVAQLTPPDSEKEYELSWKTKGGASWSSLVFGDVDYYAIWTEKQVGPKLIAKAIIVSEGVAGDPQEIESYCVNPDLNLYTVSDPGWEDSLMEEDDKDKYKCTGWYYKVNEGGDDLNGDGVPGEVTYDFETVWDAEETPEIELFIEFMPYKNVNVKYKPYGTMEKVAVGGSTQVYSYSVEAGVDTKYITCLDKDVADKDPYQMNVEDYGIVYDVESAGKLSIFNGWIINHPAENAENEYVVTADTTYVNNTVDLPSNLPAPELIEDSNGVIIKVGDYTSDVNAGYGELIGDKYMFVLEDDTEIRISPIHNGNETFAYVSGLEAYQNGVRKATTENFSINYEDHTAIVTNAYDALSDCVDVDGRLCNITLIPQYKTFKFTNKGTIGTLNAGQTSYDEESIYKAVVDAEVEKAPLKYDKDAVKVEYKALGNSYTVNLYKLFELLEADGLGVLKKAIEEKVEEKKIDLAAYSVATKEKWISLEGNPDKEYSAQEATDDYLTERYEEYKKNKDSSMSIVDFAFDVIQQLPNAISERAEHKLGYVGTAQTLTESIRVTYSTEQVEASTEAEVQFVEKRKTPEFTLKEKSVKCTYGDENITDKIIANVSVSGLANTNGLVAAYDVDAKTVRSFDGIGAGNYSVQVFFKGNDTYKTALSDSFKLIVEPLETEVFFEEDYVEVDMKGTNYSEKLDAKVTTDAPIFQVIAGVTAKELEFEVNTEGSVKDWKLEFKDKNIKVDAWVKLPKTYIDLLSTINLGELKAMSDGETADSSTSTGTITPGAVYDKAQLEKAINEVGLDSNVQLPQLKAILDRIPQEVSSRLGLDKLEDYDLALRFVALEDNKAYPTDSGFYVNYAATLSSLNGQVEGLEVDKNYTASEDYEFVLITPMMPIPNRGGVQLYDGTVDNAQNVFVYDYDADKSEPRNLNVALDGVTQPTWTPNYYGVTTRMDATNDVPTKPGVYFAEYIYRGKDEATGEEKYLGSDSVIIVIKPEEANLTITGGIHTYDGTKKIADIDVTDQEGTDISDIAAVTIISGTVGADVEGTNVSAADLRGTINVDFPDTLQNEWNKFCTDHNYNSQDKIKPSDLTTFLEECRNEAKAAADATLDGFQDFAMTDTVSAILEKVNSKQDVADVSSGNLLDKAEIVQEKLNSAVAYYNKLLEQLKPLEGLDEYASLTFYDRDKLDYKETGYYLYLGVITDPELTVDAGKGLVIICSEDEYRMFDTHVPYDGKPHTITQTDETKRDSFTMMVDREKDEITFFLDDDLFGAVNKALKSLPHDDVKLSEGSDVVVSTIYDTAENQANTITNAIVTQIQAKAKELLGEKYPNKTEEFNEALTKLNTKVDNLFAKVGSKLDELDGLPSATRIIVYSKSHAIQGMPVNAGRYEFYGYDYDVAVTGGDLVIEPVYIFVEDGIDPETGEEITVTKYQGEIDPELKAYSEVKAYSYEGTGANVKEVEIKLTEAEKARLVSYDVIRTEGEEVDEYDMSVVDLKLLDESGNYKLVEHTEDTQDFEIKSIFNKVGKTLSLYGEVYIEYMFILNESTEMEFKDGMGGIIMWNDDTTIPEESDLTYDNTNDKLLVLDNNMYYNSSFKAWVSTSTGIKAKELGDIVYARPFIRIDDDTILYGNLIEYSAEEYCKWALDNSKKDSLKATCAALLVYGAEAQKYFDYKVNEHLVITEEELEEKGYIEKYKLTYDAESMIGSLDVPAEGVPGNYDGTMLENYKLGHTLTLDGAIVIETIYANVEISKENLIEAPKLLVWTEEDYDPEGKFTYDTESCTFSVDMQWGEMFGTEGYIATLKETDTDSKYVGVPAKECGDTIYHMAYFKTKDGKIYCSKLNCYSPDTYVSNKADAPTVGNVSKALAVYSEKAREHFGWPK